MPLWGTAKEKGEQALKDNANKKTGKSILSTVASGIGNFFKGKAEKSEIDRLDGTAVKPDENERALEEARLKRIAEQQQVFTKPGESVAQKIEGKSTRRRVRLDERQERKRFGARGATYMEQPLDFFRPQSALTFQNLLEEKQNQIRVLAGKFLHNKSVSLFDRDNVVKELPDDGSREAYIALMDECKVLEDKIHQAQQYQLYNSQWENWKDGDLPKESVRDKIIGAAVDAMPSVLGKIPVIGTVLSTGFETYAKFKLSIDELADATRNIFAGTRRKTAIGRITGVIVGSLVGAAVTGGALAAIGSVVPIVGTAIGGIAGIVIGAVAGAAAGGPLGVKAFDYIATKSTRLSAERDYQMDYVHLKQLRKVYGLDEAKVLKMYSYLSNQAKISGAKTPTGEALLDMKKKALEEGREDSLAKLCVYFIGQEKVLRAGLYELGVESVNNQKQKVDLLKERRQLETDKLGLADLQSKHDIEISKNPALKALHDFKEKYQLTLSDDKLIELYQKYPLEGDQKQRDEAVQNIQEQLGWGKGQTTSFIAVMAKEELADENVIIRALELLATPSPIQAWENRWQQNTDNLASNQKAAIDIQHRRFEMEHERTGVVDLLKEFQSPAEFIAVSKYTGKNQKTWIYGDMMRKNLVQGDPIAHLFEPVKDNNGNILKTNIYAGKDRKAQQVDVMRPKDVRSFGLEEYSVIGIHEKERAKADFRESIREDAFNEAKEEGARHTPEFWKAGLEERNRKIIRDRLLENPNQISSMDQLFSFIDKKLPDFIAKLSASDDQGTAPQLNNECKALIFELQRLQQKFPDLAEFTEPKIQGLKDIQFYLDYAAIHNVYARRDLAQPQESPLHDMFPYTEHGVVQHLKGPDGKFIETDVRDEVKNRMANIALPSRMLERMDGFSKISLVPEQFRVDWRRTGQLSCKEEVDNVVLRLQAIQELQTKFKALKESNTQPDPQFIYDIIIQCNELTNDFSKLSDRVNHNENTWGARQTPQGGINYSELMLAYAEAVQSIAQMPLPNQAEIQQFRFAMAHPREVSNPVEVVQPKVSVKAEQQPLVVPDPVVVETPQEKRRKALLSLMENQQKQEAKVESVPVIPVVAKPELVGAGVQLGQLKKEDIVAAITEGAQHNKIKSSTQTQEGMNFSFENSTSVLTVRHDEEKGFTELLMPASDIKSEEAALGILVEQIEAYAKSAQKDPSLSKEITVVAGNDENVAAFIYYTAKKAGLEPVLQENELGKSVVADIKARYESIAEHSEPPKIEADRRHSIKVQ